MRLVDRLTAVLTILLAIPAIIGAVWLVRDQPEWMWWIVGSAVGGLVGAVIGWVAYGS